MLACEERSAGIEGRALCFQPADLNTEIFRRMLHSRGFGLVDRYMGSVGGGLAVLKGASVDTKIKLNYRHL